MTVQAKYGWAIGLIMAGVVGALPFRHHHRPEPAGDAQVAQAKSLASEAPENIKLSPAGSKRSLSNPGSAGDDSRQVIRPLAQSHLLPESDPDTDQRNESRFGNPASESTGRVVEQVPRKLDRDRLPLANDRSTHDSWTSDEPTVDPPDEPVFPQSRFNASPEALNELADRRGSAPERSISQNPAAVERPSRRMPETVGPYRMRPVNPSSRFQSASQSTASPTVAGTSTASPSIAASEYRNVGRSRQVIQYRLRDGDTLRAIAQRYLGDARRYEEILADNRHLLTNGENFLPVGQYITIVID